MSRRFLPMTVALVAALLGGGCVSAPPACLCPEPLARPEPAPAPKAAPTLAAAAMPTPLDLNPLMASIVQIKVKVGEKVEGGKLSQSFEYGTGFFVNERGKILTSAHVLAVLEDPRDLTVLHQGRTLQARVLKVDRKTDLAVLLVDAGRTIPLKLSARPARLGERVFAVGYPFVDIFSDTEPAVAVGHLAGAGRDIDYLGQAITDLLLTDAFVADGCSGGPLIDEKGEVLGVLRFNLSRKGTWLGLSFAQPIGSYAGKKAQ
jgi:S1-C subfamily serine protease